METKYQRCYYKENNEEGTVSIVIGLYNIDDLQMIDTKAEFVIECYAEDFYRITMYDESFFLLAEFNDLFLELSKFEAIASQDLYELLEKLNFKLILF